MKPLLHLIVKKHQRLKHNKEDMIKNFKDHYDCVSFGYDFSHKMITNLSREFVNNQGAYIKFFCEETPKVST